MYLIKCISQDLFLFYLVPDNCQDLTKDLVPGPLSTKTVRRLFIIFTKNKENNSYLKFCDAKCDNTMNEFSLALNSYCMTRFKLTHL